MAPLRNRFDFTVEHRSVHVWVKTDIIVMHYRLYRDMQDVLGASVGKLIIFSVARGGKTCQYLVRKSRHGKTIEIILQI
jgi:predicted GNAT family N-acyltransferase